MVNRMLKTVISIRFAGVVLGLWAWTAGAVNQWDIDSVFGDVSRSYLGTGKGVTIGILDGGIDARHPAINGTVVAARDFSNSRTTDDATRGRGHATGIASLYTGADAAFTGLVPDATIVNARVITASDNTNDTMSGNGLFYALGSGAKVINMSFGNRLGDGPLTSKFNLMVDYAALKYGASIVSAAGNEDDTAVGQVPAGAYNGYSIGALAPTKYNVVADFSNYALRSDQRTKPDLVAPGEDVAVAAANWEIASDYVSSSGTSFSTPIVGGVLAQMFGYGKSRGLSTNPNLLKAILLTSAQKVYDADGDPWRPRDTVIQRRGRQLYDQPLDDQQGAGRVDAMSAFRVYSRSTDNAHRLVDWEEASLKRGRGLTLDLGNLTAGRRVDASLVWSHHVERTDNGNGVVDPGDKFYETSAIANFSLALVKDGRTIAYSDSAADNLEHFSYRLNASGHYQIFVLRGTQGGERNESFAVAFRVLENAPVLSAITPQYVSADAALPATLQRGGEVPEPGAVSLVVVGSMVMLGRRSRR